MVEWGEMIFIQSFRYGDTELPVKEDRSFLDVKGLYTNQISGKMPSHLANTTPIDINCVLTIPGTNYTKRKEQLFYGMLNNFVMFYLVISFCCVYVAIYHLVGGLMGGRLTPLMPRFYFCFILFHLILNQITKIHKK